MLNNSLYQYIVVFFIFSFYFSAYPAQAEVENANIFDPEFNNDHIMYSASKEEIHLSPTVTEETYLSVLPDAYIDDISQFLKSTNKKELQDYLSSKSNKGLFRSFAEKRIHNLGRPTSTYVVELTRQIIDVFSKIMASVPVNDTKGKREGLETLRKTLGYLMDFEVMEEYVLGSHKSTATIDQLRRFDSVYRDVLISGYDLSVLYSWSGKIDVVRHFVHPDAPNDVFVIILLTSQHENRKITLRIRKQDVGVGIKIVDAIIDNTFSIMQTQKEEFLSVLNNNGIDVLISRLQALSR